MAHHGGGVFWIFDEAWLISGMSSMLTYSYVKNERERLVFCVTCLPGWSFEPYVEFVPYSTRVLGSIGRAVGWGIGPLEAT
jgi:hypothetical protein